MYYSHKTTQYPMPKTLGLAAMVFIGLSLFHTTTWAAQKEFYADPWQSKRLFSPSQNDLVLEQKGQIVIYSGLLDVEVDKAMDNYFERIDSMMFIQTIQTDENGKPKLDPKTGQIAVADDGC